MRILRAESNQSVNALSLAQPVYYDQVALAGPRRAGPRAATRAPGVERQITVVPLKTGRRPYRRNRITCEKLAAIRLR